ncbi:MAG: hypothetical protein V3W20_14830 [Candidatus Neomarinimicrobiota bacterium]
MFKLLLVSGQEFGTMQVFIFIVFITIFIGIIIWAIFANKRYINYMSKLPLEDENSIKGEY